ncbi:MAG: tyrosine-protein kinase [Chloroflexota bacterium]|jgi:capsular exopolysaccharide synthesis family protein|nr:tyrosine-protein kinase [Chloroflexota bacterium]
MIGLITLTAAVTSLLVSLQLPKLYTTYAIGLVSPKQLIPPSGGVNVSDPNQIPSIDQLVETYVGLINTDPVRRQLVKDGIPRDPDTLRFSLAASRQPNTTLIVISVYDEDPNVALAIARDVIPAFNSALGDLQAKVGSSSSSKLESLVPWEVPTKAPPTPVAPDIPKNVLLAAVGALVLSLALAYALERVDNTVKRDSDVRLKLGVALLGSTILHVAEGADEGAVELVAARHTSDPLAEEYRALRTNIMYARASQSLKTIVVTSTRPGEGKTTTSSNLAVTLAQAGLRVVLVDADFRRPDLHRVFKRPVNIGLGNLIMGDRPVDDLIVESGLPNLHVVCSGPTPPNPSELLVSNGMKRVIDQLKKRFDMVIFDTPPVGAVTDATVLAAQADGAILVVERGGTSVPAILRTIETIKSINVNLLGVVLNKARAADAADYSYYYDAEARGLLPRQAQPVTPASTAEPEWPREAVVVKKPRRAAARRVPSVKPSNGSVPEATDAPTEATQGATGASPLATTIRPGDTEE